MVQSTGYWYSLIRAPLSVWPCIWKLDEEKLTHGGLAEQNRFDPVFSREAGKRHSKMSTWHKKKAINMIWLLFPIYDWPFIMIGRGLLLLVVFHVFAVPVLNLWVRLPKST